MSYFIFDQNLNNVEGTLYRIAENLSDLNSLNISQSLYKIIEDTQDNFNAVKYGTKDCVKYNENTITYINGKPISFLNWTDLNNYISIVKNQIKGFLDNNINHSLYNRWNSYYIQLNTLTENQFVFPLNKSLEQYFNDLGQPSYNILQLP